VWNIIQIDRTAIFNIPIPVLLGAKTTAAEEHRQSLRIIHANGMSTAGNL
jgi:hypothetical protein